MPRFDYKFDGLEANIDLGKRANKAVRARVSTAVGKGLRLMQQHHKTKEIRRGGGKGRAVAHRWTTRTGTAARSFHIDWKKGAMDGAYWTGLKRMRVLEEGGTIRPKRAHFLAIPTDAAKHGVGPSGSPRHHPGLVFIQSLKGQPLLVRPDKDGPGLTVMFILRRQVTLPPRRTLQRTIDKKGPDVVKLVAAAMQEGLDDA